MRRVKQGLIEIRAEQVRTGETRTQKIRTR
jgi:hypothetical protein